ncbi:uncharacterized protein BDV17DRAFT_261669 [Aspergillus undulatus]|uniref:uncharacterized protein n=1 Tax=Aspergillus undulatus TaxID=1810928 RepID=UPI003CCDE7CE
MSTGRNQNRSFALPMFQVACLTLVLVAEQGVTLRLSRVCKLRSPVRSFPHTMTITHVYSPSDFGCCLGYSPAKL